MDAQRNSHGRMKEFARTQNGICFSIDIFLFLLCCSYLKFMDLGHDLQKHPTLYSGELAEGGSVALAVGFCAM